MCVTSGDLTPTTYSRMFQCWTLFLVWCSSFLLTSVPTVHSSSGCSKYVVLNHAIKINCQGEKSTRDYWRFNGTNLFANGNLLSAVISNVSVNENYTLLISSFSWDHIGWYECIRNGTPRGNQSICITGTPSTSSTSTVLTTPDVTSISTDESSSKTTYNTSTSTSTSKPTPTHYNIVTIAVSGACVVTLITGCFVICLRIKGSDNRIREIIETELRSFPIRPESSVEEIPSIPPRNVSGDASPQTERLSLCIFPSEVTLLSKFPGDGLIQCWLATSDIRMPEGKAFVAKTVSDAARTNDIVIFRQLAKQRQSLVSHPNIVDQIAVEVSDFPYYIYQEYLDGGNLRHFMLRNFEQSNKDHIENQSTSTATIPTDGKNLHLIQFALEVACGMAYLAYNNYRHPGLCLKKVLLTNVMTCKLYDFWPDDLSGERLRTILDKPDPPTAWLPTETIFLRQYSGESDVWSYAVLLWELFSFGSTPYAGLNADELEQEIRHGRTLPQPNNCPGGVYGMMLSSWDTVVTNRPPFSQLQEKIQTMLNALSQVICPLKGEEMSNEPKYFPLDGCAEENDYTESC
ncbi:uncharacterized protein [Apostichopus japonicus]|uniref:uncharacterized protein isoform X2 n=1 Tax=Stichopus japonicus TaxID=307972 RepID=UPI003AB3284D